MKVIELVIDEMDELGGIEAISVVENPAIEEDFIALKSQEVKLAEVDNEKRIDRKSVGRERGNQNKTTLEHQHSLNGLSLVESWIVEDETHDKSRKYDMNVPMGTWMGAVKVNNEKIWQEFVKTGKVKGFSIEGYFADKMERPKDKPKSELSKEDNAQGLIDQIKNILSAY